MSLERDFKNYYFIIQGVIEINPKQAEIVKEIFSRAINGESLSSIARDLSVRKVPCVLGGNNWNSIYIKRLLSNEKYTGNALLWKNYRNNHIEKKKTKNIGQLPMFYAEETHPAIIDAVTFEKAQSVIKKLNETSSTWSKHERTSFSGKIECGICGSRYKRRTTKTGKHWNCRTYIEKGKAFCLGCSIKEEQLISIAEEVSPDFDEISKIVIRNQEITFFFFGGRAEKRTWQKPSRKESWTPEMKKKAAEDAKKRWE